jgi:PAS domain S-box-containing protein
MQSMLENISDGCIALDERRRLIYVNRAAERFFNRSRDALLGQDFATCLPEVALPRIMELLGRAAGEQTAFEFDEPFASLGPSHVRIHPAADGLYVFFQALNQKWAQDQLRLREERYRVLVEATSSNVWRTDPAGMVVEELPSFGAFTGFSFEQYRGWGWQQTIHPDDLPELLAHWQTAVATKTVYRCEFRMLRHDGEYRYVQAKAVPLVDEQGNVREWTGACADVTESRVAETALRDAEATLRQLADAMPQIVWVANPDGLVESYNRRWYDYTGLSPELATGAGWSLALHPDDRQRAIDRWSAALRSGETYEIEYRFRRAADGVYRWFLTRALPAKDALLRITRWYGTCTDIDDFKRLQDERSHLLESERAARGDAERAGRMKDDFLNTLSHELRTPLNAILGWSHLLKMGQLSQEQITRGIDTIQRNARAQTQLIEDLLDMSRILSGKIHMQMQPVEPQRVVAAAVESVAALAADKGIQLRVTTDENTGRVWADPARLEQVVWNLLSNAVKFTPEGGHVEVSVNRRGQQIELRVGDSGRGIPRQFLPFVFDRFRQADASTTRYAGGLGLGLAIVKHLVELQGGVVSADSLGEGQGAEFSVGLPVLDPSNVQPPPPSREAHQPATGVHRDIDLAGLTVLVVDDDPDARDLARRVLEQFGAQVNTAASAAEGLEQLAERRPDVLVSDIGMPGTDGYAFMRQVRSQDTSRAGPLAAIALTAFTRAEDQRQAIEAGYQAHLTKPVDPWDLAATVAMLSGRPPARNPSPGRFG